MTDYDALADDLPNPDGPTQLSTFQGSPHLWVQHIHHADWSGPEREEWKPFPVTKVTAKSVYVFVECLSPDVRLDRAALERDGFTDGRRGYRLKQTYYTESGQEVESAKYSESQRLRKEAQARADRERTRRLEEEHKALVGEACVFCHGSAERYTEDKYPSCDACHSKACGYYRVPPGMILPFRTIA